MAIEQLEIGRWYTIGGGDSYMKCVYIAKEYAVFLSVSEVHYTINAEFLPRESLEAWGEEMYEIDYEYLEDDIRNATIPKFNTWYENFASFR